MKEFKGTKGEWKAEIRFDFKADISTESHRIAEVKYYPKPIDKKLLEPTQEEGLANVKLIASAPDLLEALQFLYDDVESWSGLHVSTKDKIEQAINKALS